MGNPAICAHQLRKHYGDTQALKGVSVDIAPGQICALLGQNGAGKTTFIHCALGLIPASSGTIEVLGEGAGSLAAKKRIGVMLQDTDLPDLLTPREHIERFACYYDNPQPTDALIVDSGIAAFAEQRYKTLSGGQKRRVQFAVALVGQPDVLFLDEPTTGLDQEARQDVWRNIRRLADSGTTVILTTHYLEEADALADRIVVIHDGQVIADDAASTIRSQVGGSMIACHTRLDNKQLEALPGVRSVSLSGRIAQLLSEDAPASLLALLLADPDLTDLTVTKPSLNEAFVALTEA